MFDVYSIGRSELFVFGICSACHGSRNEPKDGGLGGLLVTELHSTCIVHKYT